MLKLRPCGNQKCSTSTAISDQLSFGSGELDEFGFWQFPCVICASFYEKRDRAEGLDKLHPFWFPYLPQS